MISDPVKKEDVSKHFKDRPHAGHWYYTSPKGKVSMALWDKAEPYYYKAGPYEIYAYENDDLFTDIEFYHNLELAERRIMEVLG